MKHNVKVVLIVSISILSFLLITGAIFHPFTYEGVNSGYKLSLTSQPKISRLKENMSLWWTVLMGQKELYIKQLGQE